MALVTLTPFLNYHLCKDTPSLLEMIMREVQEMGISVYNTDIRNISNLQNAENIHTRVPLILYAKENEEEAPTSKFLLNTLKSKFPTASLIEGKPKDLPDLIAERRDSLNTWIEQSQNEIVKKVTMLVHENMHNSDFSLTVIANALKMSRQSIQKIFHNVGLTEGVWDYVIDMRMHEAARIIRETTLPLKEVSALFGYSEYDSFSKRFKKVFGFPPKNAPRK